MKFGQQAKDKITGFVGVLTARATYISGCDQWLVQPPILNGDYKEGKWFDVQRLEVAVDGEEIALDNTNNNGCDIPAPAK